EGQKRTADFGRNGGTGGARSSTAAAPRPYLSFPAPERQVDGLTRLLRAEELEARRRRAVCEQPLAAAGDVREDHQVEPVGEAGGEECLRELDAAGDEDVAVVALLQRG